MTGHPPPARPRGRPASVPAAAPRLLVAALWALGAAACSGSVEGTSAITPDAPPPADPGPIGPPGDVPAVDAADADAAPEVVAAEDAAPDGLPEDAADGTGPLDGDDGDDGDDGLDGDGSPPGPVATPFCRPCDDDGGCAASAPGILVHRCVAEPFGAGSFCAPPCGKDEDCPAGAACVTRTLDGAQVSVCRPAEGACTCSEEAIALGATTACAKTSSAGTCTGVRACVTGGLTPCSAAMPAPEACNGEDDDCDGATDEAWPGQGEPCDLDGDGCALGTWTCGPEGLACDEVPFACDDGNPCTDDVVSGAAETCDLACAHVVLPDCCGNGLVEAGELCDGDCPAFCDDGVACTTDVAAGDPATCDATCSHVPGPDDGSDTDGDGLADCAEATDGDAFTAPFVFNGLRAVIGEPPTEASAQCDLFFGDTWAEMMTRFDGSGQSMPVWQGWEYAAGNTNDYSSQADFTFQPPWPGAPNTGVFGSFQVLFTGWLLAPQAGTWCFSVDTGSGGFAAWDIAGRRNCCGRVYVDPQPDSLPVAETGYGAAASPATGCLALAEGPHRLDVAARHYETYFYAPKLAVRWCYGGAGPCTPDQPLAREGLQALDGCLPQCALGGYAHACGPDGCGGSCGTCPAGTACTGAFLCE